MPGTLRAVPPPTAPLKELSAKPKPEKLHTERKGTKKRAKGERVDWDGMEPHYRANKLSLRELGEMFGVTAAAILKHANKVSWSRDLTDQIDARADALVNSASVNAVNDSTDLVNGKPRVMTSAVVIQATAELIANVRLAQRTRFSRAADLYTSLFIDLEQQVKERGKLTEMIAEYESEVDDAGLGKLLGKMMRDAIALPEQIKAFKDLAAIGAQLTAQEQVAYKLDKAPEGGEGSRTDLPVRFVGTKWVEQVQPEGED